MTATTTTNTVMPQFFVVTRRSQIRKQNECFHYIILYENLIAKMFSLSESEKKSRSLKHEQIPARFRSFSFAGLTQSYDLCKTSVLYCYMPIYNIIAIYT